MLTRFSGWASSEIESNARLGVVPRQAMHRLVELHDRALTVANVCSSREAARAAMDPFFAEYRDIVRAAEIELKERLAEVYRAMDLDGWVW